MTGRERVLSLLRGEMPDRVPYCPNIGWWYDYHKNNGSLPEELRDCETELDAMLRAGFDILSRRVCSSVKTVSTGYEVVTDTWTDGRKQTKTGIEDPFGRRLQPMPGVDRIHTEVRTPVGTMSRELKTVQESWTMYEVEPFLKDFDRDFPVVRYLLEHTDWSFDEAEFRRVDEKIGDAGMIIAPSFQTPIGMLHHWAGQVEATYILMDHPDECMDLFELHTAKKVELAKQAVRSPAQVFMVGSFEGVFYTPPLVRKFELAFYQAVGEVIHGQGKWMLNHAHGPIVALRDLVIETGIDGFEALAHPPLGDMPVSDAKDLHPRMIVCGGMAPYETEIDTPDARDRIFDYVRGLFASIQPLDRFAMTNVCNTSIRTPWENLVHFGDACRELSQVDGSA